MHSQVGALSNWIYDLEEAAGGKAVEIPTGVKGRLSTHTSDGTEEGSHPTAPCVNCKVLFAHIGIDVI